MACVNKYVVREESNFGVVAGEAVLSTMTYILYFVEIPIFVCILNLIIQLPGCQDIFITVNHSQVISLRGKPDTSLGGSDYIYCIIFHFINNIKYKNIFPIAHNLPSLISPSVTTFGCWLFENNLVDVTNLDSLLRGGNAQFVNSSIENV